MISVKKKKNKDENDETKSLIFKIGMKVKIAAKIAPLEIIQFLQYSKKTQRVTYTQ